MRIVAILTAITFCAAVAASAAPAWAQYKTDLVGGAGGAPFEVVYGGYLTGLRLKQGNYVDAIGAYYTQIERQTMRFTGNQVGRGVGGPGGAEKDVRCGPGSLVVGLRFTAFDSFAGNIEPLCENLDSGFRHWAVTGWVPPPRDFKLFGPFYGSSIRDGIYSGDPMNCPSGQAAVGFHGRSGNYIDAIGLICKRLPRPDAAPPPPPPASEVMPGGSTNFTIREVGKKRRCNDYGTRAVALKEQAARCGLTGPRFDAAYDDHVRFCMANPRSRADEEDKARADALAACGATAGAGKDAYCKGYAQEAVDQANKARNAPLKCGLSGPRYDATYWEHFGWCQQVPREAAESEIRARDMEIKACISCRDWTARALDQFKRAQSCARPLPTNEARWRANSTEGHFRFCFVSQPGGLASVNGAAVQQAISRDADLAACR
jgi:hypothetical protein